MKHFISLSILLVFAISATFAQATESSYKKLRIDFMVGFVNVPAYSPENPNGYTTPGGAFSIEPRYNISDRLGIGFKFFKADVLSTSNKKDKFMSSYLADATYYFSNKVRFFTGGGVGLASQAHVEGVGNSRHVVAGKRDIKIAVMPKIGIDASKFVGNIFFHINTGRPSFYVGLSIGFFLGGGKIRKAS